MTHHWLDLAIIAFSAYPLIALALGERDRRRKARKPLARLDLAIRLSIGIALLTLGFLLDHLLQR